MANSKISMPEMTLVGYGLRYFQDAKAALAEMPKASRWFHIFWLLGPLILLIERSPADAWLTICALTFVVRAIVRRDSSWLKVFWVRAVFAFWGVCLLSAALSELPAYSLGEAFIWIRFPLFAMASCFWLGADRRLLYAMMGSTMLGMIIMSGILIAEFLIVGQQGGRLSWPYGDLVPGNYLAKVSLFIFCLFSALAFSSNKNVNNASLILVVSSLAISMLTGERINFLIRFCSAILAAFVWQINVKRLFLFFGLICTLFVIIFVNVPMTLVRFVSSFLQSLPTNSDSLYFHVLNSGVQVFQNAPILGVGPGNYRFLCAPMTVNVERIDCDVHPHNFLIQLLAETGTLGFLTGIVLMISIFAFTLKPNKNSPITVAERVAFIAPLALFFPLQTTADFFGQWNNIFMWSALAMALAVSKCRRLG